MKRVATVMMGLTVMCASAHVAAYEGMVVADEERQCYGRAMIGYDSVINSRLGVPAEHALDLARVLLPEDRLPRIYSTSMLNTVLDAYFWQESPHSYAIKVFYRCAAKDGAAKAQLAAHQAEWIFVE